MKVRLPFSHTQNGTRRAFSGASAHSAAMRWLRQRVGRPLLSTVDQLLEFVFPPRCLLCSRGLDRSDAASGQTNFCADCRDCLVPAAGEHCRRCGAPVGPYTDSSMGCYYCRKERFAFATVVCLGVYAGALRQACLTAKSRGKADLAGALAMLLWEQTGEQIEDLAPTLVASVPQHWWQRVRTTHSVSDVVGTVLARRLQTRWAPNILAKVRWTRKQSGLPPSQRRTNVKGAFGVTNPRLCEGQRILLVDDVLTTGSTAHECARALNKAGASHIAVAVLARGLGRTITS